MLYRFFASKFMNFGRVLFRSSSRDSAPDSYLYSIRSSGIFGNPSFRAFKYLSAWAEAEKKWNQGAYSTSVTLRSEVLQEIYGLQGISDPNYFPPFLSKEFGTAFGHVGLMAAHQECSKIGIIPSGLRSIPISEDHMKREITKSILRDYTAIPTETCGEIFDLPSAWHISERPQMVKTSTGFIDLFVMLERLYGTRIVDIENPILSLDDKYEEKARFELRRRGLTGNSWFVTLHIRNAGPAGMRRNQPNQSYLAAIRFITSQGGTVVRIGDSSMEVFPKLKGFIDLSSSPDDYWLHSYALANGKLHIGTTSGPDWIPSLFGVPTLITNTTAIGRNAHTLCTMSRFIPKHVVSRSDKWSLERILGSSEAYAENELDEKVCGYRLEPNSEQEILLATQEMYFDVLEGRKTSTYGHMLEVNRIREQNGAVGYGAISQSFLELNASTFLK